MPGRSRRPTFILSLRGWKRLVFAQTAIFHAILGFEKFLQRGVKFVIVYKCGERQGYQLSELSCMIGNP